MKEPSMLAQPETVATGWRTHARCRDVDVDVMVPGGPGEVGTAGQIRRAKRVCQGCRVRGECLQAALGSGDEGVWGGLDQAERMLLETSRRADHDGPAPTVRNCTRCGLTCVPQSPAGPPVCELCRDKPAGGVKAEDHRVRIEWMILNDYSYTQIGVELGLSKYQVMHACQRWGISSKVTYSPADPASLQPCGTPAALLRHRRNNPGISRDELTCACRLPMSGSGRAHRYRNPQRQKTEGTAA
jgi:WhiB family redox-sensing transcriptional regulator